MDNKDWFDREQKRLEDLAESGSQPFRCLKRQDFEVLVQETFNVFHPMAYIHHCLDNNKPDEAYNYYNEHWKIISNGYIPSRGFRLEMARTISNGIIHSLESKKEPPPTPRVTIPGTISFMTNSGPPTPTNIEAWLDESSHVQQQLLESLPVSRTGSTAVKNPKRYDKDKSRSRPRQKIGKNGQTTQHRFNFRNTANKANKAKR